MVADGSNRDRVVVLGAGGFVGRATTKALVTCGYDVESVSRSQIDLTDVSQAPTLAKTLAGAKAVVFASAITPDVARSAGRDATPDNLAMAATLAACAASCPDLHMVYLSSDAVYGTRDGFFDEGTPVAPDDAYGRMHVAREQQMQAAWPTTSSVLRLSQVYGPGDTHNAYGPCRFVRQALAGEPVGMFGEGEDARDHIWIDDVAKAISTVIEKGYFGTVCVSSGMSPPFFEIAAELKRHFSRLVVRKEQRSVAAVTKRFDNTVLRHTLHVVPIDIATGLARFADEERSAASVRN